jgi:hypothetical protein
MANLSRCVKTSQYTAPHRAKSFQLENLVIFLNPYKERIETRFQKKGTTPAKASQ